MTEGLHGLHGWQYLFMVLGGITVVYSFGFWVRPPPLAVRCCKCPHRSHELLDAWFRLPACSDNQHMSKNLVLT